MKIKNLRQPAMLMFVLLCSIVANATPRMIANADIKWNINSISQLTAFIDIQGLLDRPDDDGVYRNGANKGEIQYRLPQGTWTVLGGAGSGPVISSGGWSPGSRTVYAAPITYASLDLRVCNQAEGCSAPYVVNLTPKIHLFGGAAPGIVSTAQPILKVYMRNVAATGVTFTISQNYFDSFGIRQLLRPKEATIIGTCNSLKDTFCDVQVPAEVLAAPGDYMLSVFSSLGAQENMKKFEVVNPAKPLLVVPDGIRSKLLSIIKLQIPHSNSANQTTVKVKSPLCPTAVDGVILDSTNTELVVKIPPPCLPDTGKGELQLEIKNRSMKVTNTLPFDIQ